MLERYVHVPPRPDAAIRSAHGRALSRVAACRASRSRGGPTTVETAIQEDTVSVGLARTASPPTIRCKPRASGDDPLLALRTERGQV